MVCIVQIELFWSIDSVFLLACSLVSRERDTVDTQVTAHTAHFYCSFVWAHCRASREKKDELGFRCGPADSL